MSCWEVLGLDSTADARSIKRHYAALLKRNRPEDDPAAFQRLREAYEQALEASQQRATPSTYQDDAPPSRANLAAVKHAAQPDSSNQEEDLLLTRCLSATDDFWALATEGLKRFRWLTPWQRNDLPRSSLALLEQRLFAALAQHLSAVLAQGDIDAFTREYLEIERQDWLANLERHDRLAPLLAKVMLESPFWSTQLFISMCKLNDWYSEGLDSPSTCPEPFWSALRERNEAEAFLEQQLERTRGLETVPDNRAAYLFLAPLTNVERKAFSRRFRVDDWQACHRLADIYQNQYPQFCERLPEGDPFFWREWESPSNRWLTLCGVLVACGVGAVERHLRLQAGLADTAMTLTLWSLMFSGIAAASLWIGATLSDSIWRLDARLSERFCALLTPRRPTPLLVRELLPCWITAIGIGLYCGVGAFASYGAVMTLLAWIDARQERRLGASGRPARPASWRIAIGLCLVVAMTIPALNLGNRSTVVNTNQGLQPWLERLCSRQPDTAEACRVPATREQWYGEEMN